MQIAWHDTGSFGLSRGDVFIQGPPKYYQTVTIEMTMFGFKSRQERGTFLSNGLIPEHQGVKKEANQLDPTGHVST